MKKLFLYLFVVVFATNIIYSQDYNYPVVTVSSADCNNITYQVYMQGAGTGTNRFLCYVLNKPTGDTSYANIFDNSAQPLPAPFPCAAPGGYQPPNYSGSDDTGVAGTEIGFTNDYAYITVPAQVGYNSITILGYYRLGIFPFIAKRVPPTNCLQGYPNSGWKNVIPQAYAEFYKDGLQSGATVQNPVTFGIANVQPPFSAGYTGVLGTPPTKPSNIHCKGQDLYLYFTDSSFLCGLYGSGFGYVCDISGTNTATNISGTTIPGQCLFYLPPDIYPSFIKIPGSMLTNTGLTTINLKAVITGSSNDEVSSNGMNCYVVSGGTTNLTNYNYVIDIVDVPDLSGTNTVSVVEPICLGNGTNFSFNSSSLANGTYNVSYYLSGSNNGLYVANNVTFNSGTSNISIPSTQLQVSGTTTLEIISVQNTTTGCTTSTTPGTVTDSFVVGALPDVTGTNSVVVTEPLCLGSNGTVTFNASALADGTYNINYSLTGANASTQTASGVIVASGIGTFIIPSAVLTNPGSTTISIDGITNSATSCTTTITPGTITDSFVIEIVPNLSGTNSVVVTEPMCLGSNGTVTVNASALADGTYTIAYTLTGANNTPGAVLVTGVVFTSGTGTFTIPSASLSNLGTTNISIDFISNEATTCTSYGSGTITDSFVVGALPNVSGTNSVVVTEPLCLGSNGTVTFNASAMANGTYNINYTLTGANASTQTASSVVVASGTGTFTIPSAVLSSPGSTTISLSSVVASATGCSTTITPGTITDSFVVGVLPDVSGSNSISVTEPLCLGSNGAVSFSSSALANGTYNIAYNLSGANIGNQTASNVVVASGTGTFTIPSAALTNSGSSTISITTVINSTTLCSTSVSAGTITDTFTITASPNVSGANSVVVTEPLCLGSNGTVTFNSSAMANGTYNITYNLSGANTSSQTANSVAFLSGSGTFTIPSASLTNIGSTTITVNTITNISTLCTSTIPGTITDSFVVGTLPNVSGTNSVVVTEPLCLGSNGTVTFNASAMANGTYNINYTLTGANASTQTASSVVVASGTGTFTIPSAVLSSSGSTTISLSSVVASATGCTTTITPGTITDSFVVGTLPNVSGTNSVVVIEPLCLGSNGTVTFNASAMANGTYNINYTLTGANASTQTASSVVVASGTGTFTIPSAVLSSPGSTTISLSSVVASATGCTTTITPGTITDSFVVGTLPNVSGTNSVVVTEPLCLGSNGTVTFNASAMANGTYNINYTLTGANASTQTASSVVVASGTGTFTIPSAVLSSSGSTTISLSSVVASATGCTTTITPGTITDSFVVGTLPNVSGTNSVVVTEPLCLGSNGTVTFNASAMANGTYNINYTLTGANASTQTASSVVVASGTGTFTIPSAVLSSSGVTTISLSSVVASATGCTTTITPGTITDSFVVGTLPNVSGTNSVVVTEPLCLGSNGTVTFNASAMANGTYNINYTLTGANASTQTASSVVVASGTGTFTIPSAVLSSSGVTTISLSSVVASATGCTTTITPGTITDSFVVGTLPNVSGTNSVVVTEPLCLGSNGTVTFNASAMANGTYNINYTLTGANASTQTASSVVVASGTGTFTIPSAVLSSSGVTTISLSSVVASATGCTTTITPGTITDSFVVGTLPNVSGTNSVVVTEPLCLGSNGTVTFNASAMANGTYNINYTLTGANASTQTASSVVVASGTGTFTIPSAVLSSSGVTTISLSSVVASATGCTTTITPGTITDSFVVGTLPNVSGTNSVVVAQPMCLGSIATVTFNSSTLVNGTYNIAYTLSGANTGSYTASSVVVASGTGTFTIPFNQISFSGNTTIVINSVSNSTSLCSSSLTLGSTSFIFFINELPNVTGDSFQEFCTTINATINNLVVSYNNVNWYDSPTSTTILPLNTPLINGNIYYGEGVNPTTGCISEQRLEVSVGVTNCAFLIPDGFSPNGDGVNDMYNIVNGASYYPNYEFEVFDRYGSKIFKGKSWDGRLNGNLLPTGVYFIIVYYNDNVTKATQHRIYLNK